MDYKNTVFLPKTDFAMKANLAQRELDFIAYWEGQKLYQRLRKKSKGKPRFILHFGPPYANGHIHMGHALSEVLKDIVTKTYQMKGYDAPLVPGWDCHGLPIEWKIEENYRTQGLKKEDVPPHAFLQECRAFAQKWMDIQKDEFKRLGIVADWENPYCTMEPTTEAAIAAQLLGLVSKGFVYKGLKPVMWSVVEKTALAEAEVEYHEHTSDSIYVKFNIVHAHNPLLKGASAVIWTTTPWTLPGNRAIAYGEDIDYQVIEMTEGTDSIAPGQRLLMARALVPHCIKAFGGPGYAIVGELKGAALAGAVCHHPWHGQGYDFDVPLLPGEHVTTEAGTGLVHTAPGHGLEDFNLGSQFNIEVPATVGDDGVYYSHVPLVAGQHIFKVHPHILDLLRRRGALLHSGKIVHSYPHSWRSKSPLIFRTTAQWFVDMDKLRTTAVEAITAVHWFPAQGKNRILSMVENRPDWCISRQRSWGVPIPLFVHRESGDVLVDEAVNQRIISAIAEKGIEAWNLLPAEHFLGSTYNVADYDRVHDILDVWFDSACTHAFVLQQRPELAWPADVYFEGSDQHRGWFQSSLLQSCASMGRAPYKNVVTHGFVLDEKGYKMSKSQGNTVSPQQIMSTLGADILRLWVVNCDYTEDLRIGADILKHQEDIYRRFRNTLRYLLGALDGFDTPQRVAFEDLPELERFMLHQLTELNALHEKSIGSFALSPFYMALHNFCAVDLSAFFFDIRKDALYCDKPDSLRRAAARTVMYDVLHALLTWLAPVLSFTTEEAWQAITGGQHGSIHEQAFLTMPDAWRDEALAARWGKLRDLRRVMTSALEIERTAKTIGSSLQAHIAVYTTVDNAALLSSVDVAELAITSAATIVTAQAPAGAVRLDDVADCGVLVTLAEGDKCPRCWRILPEVNNPTQERAHPALCYRCEGAVS
jgi:isoleucyl-tRNA synthetase